MKVFAWKSLVSFYIFVVVTLASTSATKAVNSESVFSYLREKYDDLPENGKFATGALVGFGASRVAIKSAVGVVKVAGAAFIATEVMNAAGVLDDIPKFSNDQTEVARNMKVRALTYAENFRTTVRNRLNPEKLKSLMETDRMATMGVAAGAFVGFLL